MIHLVTLDFPPVYTGGVAQWVHGMALALMAQGQAVRVHAKAGQGTQAWDAAQPYPIARMKGRSWVRHQARWVLLQLPGALSPQDRVVFATWPLARLLGPWLRERAAVVLQGSEITAPDADLRAYVDCASQVGAVLAVSEFLARRSRQAGALARVMPMPLAHTPAPGPGGEHLLVVARLNHLKGVDRALELAEALQRELWIIGEGPAMAQLQSQAGPRVRFLGRLPHAQVLEHMGRCAALLALSRAHPSGAGAEGLGLVALEAQERGARVITSGLGGLAEATGPGFVLASCELDPLRRFLEDPAQPAMARAWAQAHHSPALAARCLLQAIECCP